jgi:hypothetical protein
MRFVSHFKSLLPKEVYEAINHTPQVQGLSGRQWNGWLTPLLRDLSQMPWYLSNNDSDTVDRSINEKIRRSLLQQRQGARFDCSLPAIDRFFAPRFFSTLPINCFASLRGSIALCSMKIATPDLPKPIVCSKVDRFLVAWNFHDSSPRSVFQRSIVVGSVDRAWENDRATVQVQSFTERAIQREDS